MQDSAEKEFRLALDITKLIDAGREEGHPSYNEVNDLIPHDVHSLEDLDEDPEFCDFLQRVSDAGISGRIRLPKDVDGCRAAIKKSELYTTGLSQEFLQLAAAHTADERIQDRVVRELWKRSAAAHRPLEAVALE